MVEQNKKRGPEKGHGGRPPHEPSKVTRELVQLHSSIGTRQEVISSILEISVPTLEKHYRKELDEALSRANASVGGALYNKAVKDKDTTAMIFWMKTRAKWSERVELSGPDGGAIPVAIHRIIIDPKEQENGQTG